MDKRRGFTLLELMIVIIIIGVLATIGIMQYQSSIERSRGAEARSIIGSLRTQCAALYMEASNTSACTTTTLRMGTASDLVPSACRSSHYFSYGIATNAAGSGITFTATRCTTNGKTPNASAAGNAVLTTDYSAGSDSWSGTY